MITIYFQSHSYQTPYLYFWESHPSTHRCIWPGYPMSPAGKSQWRIQIEDIDSAQVIVSDRGMRQSPAFWAKGTLWLEESQWPYAQEDPLHNHRPGQAPPPDTSGHETSS